MIERVYPGVFLTEVAFSATPIEGVPTSTAGAVGPSELLAQAHALVSEPPPWTDANTHDPGVTPVQLLAWLGESITYRAAGGAGVVNGLAVEPAGKHPSVQVTPGYALAPDGHPVRAYDESAHRPIHHRHDP